MPCQHRKYGQSDEAAGPAEVIRPFQDERERRFAGAPAKTRPKRDLHPRLTSDRCSEKVFNSLPGRERRVRVVEFTPGTVFGPICGA